MTDTSVTAAHAPDAIAVVGMAGRFPGSADISEFWQHCVSGDECITRWSDDNSAHGRVPAGGLLADPDRFDASFFGVAPNEAELLDPQHRVFLELSWHALESASVVPGDERLTVAVYAAAAPSRYRVEDSEELDENERYRRMIANSPDFLATRVSYLLDLRGEAVNVQTACSSSLVAVHLAVRNLQFGLSDVALAGGVYLDPDQSQGYRYQEGMIASPDGHCRPFDAKAGGMVPGNGAGVVVLQRLEDAVAQGRTVHAIIRSTATNNDGSAKTSFMAPNVRGQSEVIASALALADVPAESIGYFEAHGTGTRLGDSIEIEAARRAFEVFTDESSFCTLGSLKANFGHLDRAAGIAGLIKTICAVREGIRPPLADHTEANPELDLERSPFRVTRVAEPWPEQPRRAAVSSFGVGGTNAHAIIEQYTPSTTATANNAAASPADNVAQRPMALPLSAPNRDGLLRLASTLASHLNEVADEPVMEDVAHTLAAGRRAHEGARAVVIADDATGAREALRALTSPIRPHGPGPLVFTFPGQAAAFSGQDEALYRDHPVFRTEIDACASALDLSGPELLRGLSGTGTSDSTAGNPYQPAHVAVQIARSRLLMNAGVHPDACVGSSLGEYTAAYLAGVFARGPLMQLLDTRDQLMRSSATGAMLSVACSPDEVADLVGREIALAADNAPDRIVIAGALDALAEAERLLIGRGHRCRRLPGNIAFHSPLMDPLLSAFRQAVEQAKPEHTSSSAISTLTGTWITPNTWADPDYWVRHLREPIRFRAAMDALTAAGYRRFVELGPGHALTNLVLRTVPPPTSALSMRDSDGNEGFGGVVAALGQLWADGEAVDWDAVNATGERRFTELPGYPFEAARYWRHAPTASPQPPASTAIETPEQVGEIASPVWLAMPRSGHLAPAGPRRYALAVGPHADAPSRALAATLTARLERLGHAVETVFAPRQPATPAENVVDLTLLDPSPTGQETPDTEPTLVGWLERGLLAPTRSTLAHRPAARRAIIVTRGLFTVARGDRPDPGVAAVIGLVRCAPHDLPGLTTHLIDLDPHDSPGTHAIADALMAELADPSPRDVAFRDGVRYAAHYLPAVPSGPARLRNGGTYLVLGGTGRLGAVVARAISEDVRATVLLAGRNPDRIPSTERAALLSRARANGCTVQEIAVDITDSQALVDCVQSIVATHGKLDGLFHLAGHTDTQDFPVLEETDTASAVALATAKVRGAALLPPLVESLDCEFVMLFSSVSAVVGACGFGAYVSANAYLDSLAAAERARTGRAWTSVCWDGWSPDGTSRTGLLGVDDGVRLIRRALRTNAPVVVAVTGRVERLREKVAEDLRRVAEAAGDDYGPDPAQPSARSTVLSVVTEVTGQQPGDLTTDLSRMGVDSLQMMQIAARLRAKLQADLSLATMLRATSVEELVQLCAPNVPSGASAEMAPVNGQPASLVPTGRLTSMQQRLWYLWQLDPDGCQYNIPFGWSFPGVDAEQAHAAVDALLERHTALRTAYRPGADGEPRRALINAGAIPVDVVDVHGHDTASREAAFAELTQEWTRRSFALDQHAVRVLIATQPTGTRVLFVCHHVSVDAWSVDLIRHDLTAMIGGSTPESLPALTASYDDFAAWEDSVRLSPQYTDHLRYWAEITEDLRITVPPRDPQADGDPDHAGELRCLIHAETLSRLREAVAAAGATLYMAGLTALVEALAAWCGTEEVVIGTNLANRSLPEFESVVGMFVDPVVLRIRPRAAGPRFSDVLGHVREVFVDAVEHSDVAYQDVVRHSGLGGGNLRNPLFSVITTMFEAEGASADVATAPTPLALPAPQRVKFDLSVEFQPSQAGLLIHVIFPTSAYLPTTIQRFAENLVRLLTGFAELGETFVSGPTPVQEKASAGMVRERFGRRFGHLSPPATTATYPS